MTTRARRPASTPVFAALTSILTMTLLVISFGPAAARDFTFQNITDLPNGPGEGKAPSINDEGDIAFFSGTDVYFYDRSGATFTNLGTLPGAPPDAWFPRLNSTGNIAMIDPFTRNLWLYEAVGQTFTNISSLPGFPGNTGANFLRAIFDLSDADQVCFHSGDNNFGDVWVYDHAGATFTKVTDRIGGPARGRECRINDADQVAYNGFPDLYVYDLNTQQTVNVTDLPGGPGTGLGGGFSLNDAGDIALYQGSDVTYYEASSGDFLYLSTIAGFPPDIASTDSNDLSNSGEIVFWRANEIHYFDPGDQTFTQLTGGSIPSGGMESSINGSGEVAFNGGIDVYLAVPVVTAVPRRPEPMLALRQNVPNPFNPSTVIEYDLPREGLVELTIHDTAGRVVRKLIDGHRSAGPDEVTWFGRDANGMTVPAGVYFYRLLAGDVMESRKMVLLP